MTRPRNSVRPTSSGTSACTRSVTASTPGVARARSAIASVLPPVTVRFAKWNSVKASR
jgi:hypothetical protein